MATISRQEYNNLFGPTVGDKIRLGDTDLYVEIEKDLREYGDEVVYGGGKTIRDGMGLANTMTSEEGALDLVITNVTIIDANLGVVKADVGVKDGKIAGIGKAGNPNIMHGVHPDLVTSTATDAISGEHLILTAAGIDAAVAALPEKCREVFTLSYLQGFSHREISERLGIAQSTVENHIYLALKALRSKLSKSELLMLLFFIFLCNNSQSFG